MKNTSVLGLIFIILAINLAASFARSDANLPHSIYGNDDRKELYQVTDPKVRRNFGGVVSVLSKKDVIFGKNGMTLTDVTAGEELNLCPTEPFAHEHSNAYCSGSLIAPDVVMSAGHCITNRDDCADAVIAFDFDMNSADQDSFFFPNDSVYFCKKILVRHETESGLDYELLKLDRPVVGREPLSVDTASEITSGENVYVVGHPWGLPSKYDTGHVRKGYKNFFRTNLDTYVGNSGSPVFSADTGDIIGVLIRGEDDLVPNGQCMVSTRCPEDSCMGEDVVRASVIFNR